MQLDYRECIRPSGETVKADSRQQPASHWADSHARYAWQT
jgi:hypothetical protein